MSKSNKVCPHCRTRDCFDSVAEHNAEAYGSHMYKMKCKKCGKPIRVRLERVVVLAYIMEGHADDCPDF
jgi:hypothetical protein